MKISQYLDDHVDTRLRLTFGATLYLSMYYVLHVYECVCGGVGKDCCIVLVSV